MDVLTFTERLVGHLVWPLVVAGLVVFLAVRHRTAFEDMIRRVEKAKAGLVEFQLAQAKVEADAAGLPPAEAPALPVTEKTGQPEPTTGMLEASLDYNLALADTNPRQAVLEAYAFMNAYLLTVAYHPDMEERVRYTDGSPAVLRFAVATLLAPEHADVLERLRETAVTALEEDVSPRQARQYVQLVKRLLLAVDERLRTLEVRSSGSSSREAAAGQASPPP
jgi:hypothetical protein